MNTLRFFALEVFLLGILGTGLLHAETTAEKTEGTGQSLMINLLINNSLVKFENGTVRIPASTQELVFRVGDPKNAPNANPEAKRVRYQFEGVDEAWIQRRGFMRFGIRFYDSKGSMVGQKSFPAEGSSSGWNKTVENSTFTHQRQLVQVPHGASSLEIYLSSAGPPSSVGIYLATDIQVSRISDSSSSSIPLLETVFTRNSNNWVRDGTQPLMAKLIPMGMAGMRDFAFGIVDDDPMAHAEWHQAKDKLTPVEQGTQLILQWNEIFNTGYANMFYVPYQLPPPGRYRFRVNELDTQGLPTPRENTLEIIVPLPYWKNPWILSACALAAGIGLFFLFRYFTQVKIRRKLARLQQKHLVEQERLRIARDIHDDLGTRLANISLMSGMAEKNAGTDADRNTFRELSSLARELVVTMYETIWTVNPENDTLDSLVSFICQSTETLCRSAGVRCRAQISSYPENLLVQSEIRHHVILSVKESVHNAVKYSGTAEIGLAISFREPFLEVEISDIGCGFVPLEKGRGQGLKNMRRRMEAIHGSLTLKSVPSEGTRVLFRIPLPVSPS